MIRSALARRVVTGVSVVILLLCQTAAVALACVITPPPVPVQTAAHDAAVPCHSNATGTDGSQPENGCLDRCPSRYSSIETAKLNIPAADSLALMVFTVAPPSAAATPAAPYEQILACAASPPLILVYCRLLI